MTAVKESSAESFYEVILISMVTLAERPGLL